MRRGDTLGPLHRDCKCNELRREWPVEDTTRAVHIVIVNQDLTFCKTPSEAEVTPPGKEPVGVNTWVDTSTSSFALQLIPNRLSCHPTVHIIFQPTCANFYRVFALHERSVE